jgi:hypothetical protein
MGSEGGHFGWQILAVAGAFWQKMAENGMKY